MISAQSFFAFLFLKFEPFSRIINLFMFEGVLNGWVCLSQIYSSPNDIVCEASEYTCNYFGAFLVKVLLHLLMSVWLLRATLMWMDYCDNCFWLIIGDSSPNSLIFWRRRSFSLKACSSSGWAMTSKLLGKTVWVWKHFYWGTLWAMSSFRTGILLWMIGF